MKIKFSDIADLVQSPTISEYADVTSPMMGEEFWTLMDSHPQYDGVVSVKMMRGTCLAPYLAEYSDDTLLIDVNKWKGWGFGTAE